jgi:signal transduction histidine kinase
VSWLPPVTGQRETAAVSTPPHPPTASSGERATGSPFPPPSPVAASAEGDGAFDWEPVRRALDRWYRPLLEPEGWRALGYVFVGLVTSYVLFGLAVAALATSYSLLFIYVGVPLTVVAFSAVRAMTAWERRGATWIGRTIAERPLREVTGFGPRAFVRVSADPERWRLVGFLFVNTIVSPLLFTAAFAVPGFVLGQMFSFNVFGGLVGVALAGAAPRIAIVVAQARANIVAWFLGPDELAGMRERVTTLSLQRQDILDAVAHERRRIERNLHDGVQQQLVAIGIDLGLASNHLDSDPERARALLAQAREKVQGSIGELRLLGRGLHPAILEDRGLDAALSAVVSGAPMPISVHIEPDLDLSTDVAETLYFVANEAVANVLKHAHARVASIHVATFGNIVRITIHDDGRGGADARLGSGLAGIRARVHGVDGRLTVTSPVGGPTTVIAEVPRHG